MENNQLIEITVFSAIIIITPLVAYLFRRFYFRKLKSSTFISRNATEYRFVGHVVTALIYLIGMSLAVYKVQALQTLATSLLAGAGLLAVAVGFASQKALSNIISGIFIVVFKPFKVNDRLRIKDKLSGVVEDITLRHTVIRDPENRRIIIPNSTISDEILINSDLEDSKICKLLEIGISYDSDIDLAKAIMQEEAMKHPSCLDVRTPAQVEEGKDVVVVRVVSLGEFAVTLRAYIWAADNSTAFAMGCDLNESIKKRFDAAGIEIPFPYRTLVFKNQLNGEINMKEMIRNEKTD